MGKGQKLAEFEIHPELLSIIKIYRLALNKLPLPIAPEHDYFLVSKKTGQPLKVSQLFKIVKAIGQLAARKFNHEPHKAEKLLRLSPHWMRHKLASDLANAGCNAIEIKDILRHESMQTTQIYTHSEREGRRLALKKISAHIKPKLYTVKEETLNTELKILLKGKPLNGEYEFSKFIQMLQEYIFVNLKWEKKESLEDLIARFKNLSKINEPIEIVYKLRCDIGQEQLTHIQQAVIREAELRAFKCEILF